LTRIIYSGDVHGSEEVWLKFLASHREFKADVIMMNGDLTGKKIVPICKMEDGTWKTPFVFGRDWTLRTDDEISEFERRVRFGGMYPYRAAYKEVMELAKDRKRWEALFDDLMKGGVERWMKLVEEKVDPKVRVIVNPGNDDTFSVDEAIKQCERIIYPLDKVVYLDDHHPMVSCEWTNSTPWNSPREEPDGKLEKRLERVFSMVNEYENLVCNLHCPPNDSMIDMAPKLDDKRKPIMVGGNPIMIPVGSTAVRKIIEKYQPMLGLHAHIHESAGEIMIGRTLCLNPGSEYDTGVFRAYILDLSPSGIENHWRVYG